jgi:hypothetical protein
MPAYLRGHACTINQDILNATFLDRVSGLLQFDFGPIRCLCELLFGFAVEHTGFAGNLHLFVTDKLAGSSPDFPANLFRETFYSFTVIPHDILLGMRTAMASWLRRMEFAIAEPTASRTLSPSRRCANRVEFSFCKSLLRDSYRGRGSELGPRRAVFSSQGFKRGLWLRGYRLTIAFLQDSLRDLFPKSGLSHMDPVMAHEILS